MKLKRKKINPSTKSNIKRQRKKLILDTSSEWGLLDIESLDCLLVAAMDYYEISKRENQEVPQPNTLEDNETRD